jgi:hypothetical protein
LAAIFKFGHLNKSRAECPYQYEDTWARQETTGPVRLVIAPSSGHVNLLHKLAAAMNEPYGLLYVLHTPRNDVNSAGRYQSPEPISGTELESFLQEFSDFLEGDGRHQFWIGAADNSALLVYDNHNVIYAYGPLENFQAILLRNGFSQSEKVVFPDPHVHRCNPSFDERAGELLKHWSWKKLPLQDSDV